MEEQKKKSKKNRSMSEQHPTERLGTSCGSVGRTVASDTRGLWFESSRRQSFITSIVSVNCLKDENKEKEAGSGPI